MKIIVAPNEFKGSMTARAAAMAMTRGINKAVPDANVVQVPVADGGDGMVSVLADTLGGDLLTYPVSGPLFADQEADLCYVSARRMAAVEMALASGLALLHDTPLNPEETTTLGTGELIAKALDLGAKHIAVGIGGSATNDGGIGMAAALGVRFLDSNNKVVRPVGGALASIRQIDMTGLDPRIQTTRIEAVCDVDNPLIGPKGAAAVYGPQKGATPAQVRRLDAGLSHLAELLEEQLGVKVNDLPGAGAAGGLGAGLHAFCGAELRKGVDIVLDLVGLESKLEGAGLVLTGEGQIDFQTAFGKAPAGVAAMAMAKHIPCLAIAGSVGTNLEKLHEIGINAVFSLCPGPITLKQAMDNSTQLLEKTTEQVVRTFMSNRD